ncbi:hypothetical protein BGP_6573 [Beggiatoa sp. PS]|nr:hypothetical protein BGP_6573 [Beggiatoa sp. PS]
MMVCPSTSLTVDSECEGENIADGGADKGDAVWGKTTGAELE